MTNKVCDATEILKIEKRNAEYAPQNLVFFRIESAKIIFFYDTAESLSFAKITFKERYEL